jgi:NYN domain-containing protein/OST-HTH/LOTUS domain-containing protein
MAEGNIALLIDADNASPTTLDPVLTALAELGTVNIRRIYGNWEKPGLSGWTKLVPGYALDPQQQFDITKGKNATDMKMTIDAMDLLHSGRVTGFGIMSSDGDFSPVIQRIRQDGVPVYGFGRSNAPEAFRAVCTRFLDVAELQKAHEQVQAEVPTSAHADESELIELLIGAYNAARRDENGFAQLAEIGSIAGNRSSFDARNYGAKRLSDLIERLPNFKVERREGGQVYVRRLK